MFCQKLRLQIASLRIGKHRIVKKTEHRPLLQTRAHSQTRESSDIKKCSSTLDTVQWKVTLLLYQHFTTLDPSADELCQPGQKMMVSMPLHSLVLFGHLISLILPGETRDREKCHSNIGHCNHSSPACREKFCKKAHLHPFAQFFIFFSNIFVNAPSHIVADIIACHIFRFLCDILYAIFSSMAGAKHFFKLLLCLILQSFLKSSWNW